ncbi:MAG: putative transporter permease protein [Chloroflexi bacterium]|nr:putative transporter permease protein [Chloroflexota bacterium]
MDRLTEPFQLTFMQHAFAASLLIGLTCGVLGVYVVLRRMAFIGDAVSHTVMPGLVAAYTQGWSLLGGALVSGIVTALGIGWISRRGLVREDTAIGVVFTGLFALGVVMISATKSFKDVNNLLFGNVLGVTPEDVAMIAGSALVVCAVLALLHKELELTSFDPIHAQVAGLNADVVRYVLLFLLVLAVVVGIQAVGVVLLSGLLITPAATASLLTNRLQRMMLLSVVDAFVSVTIGLYASYYFNVSTGGAIVLAAAAIFVVVSGVRAAKSAL